MVTLKQYELFTQIPTGTTKMEYHKSIAELFEWDTAKLTEDKLDEKVSLFLKGLVENPKEHKYIRLKGKWFVVDRDLYNLKFDQWIYLDQVMKLVDKKNVQEHIYKIISSFIRPCRLWKWFPKKFNMEDANKYSEYLHNLDIRIGLELSGFFFLYTVRSMNNTKIEYSEKLEKEIWEKTKEPKNSKKLTDGI